eukprot:Gregarina_sp_Pseudo_9__14@NODE_100_length_4287_cov_62_735876_g92_i0_p2_GENE_NODE_100_length_4287_cov_62_735876_g92_i0NODE_100_length_4287_cov_62_735876_g92_i0_p2_ORF_typecomplete_len494_score85_37MFS_1/PF07690_16/3_6e20MFS_1/PF07690_16/8_5e02UNC93/PF05978_16/5_8e09UNC93/PF05978_16/7_6e03UNC93/PF05978_16/5_1e03MFS_2/PF13347_6/43MFS_2/PF13347_6/2_2e07MFS_2/PF13347_6/72TLC/PF03219_14/5_5TLC/PF03219_14/0_27TLC/PF03219_14/3_8e03TLC/PF03219_14/1_1e03_NODE_100_length_4287_cov_62_735876_g92_i026904171
MSSILVPSKSHSALQREASSWADADSAIEVAEKRCDVKWSHTSMGQLLIYSICFFGSTGMWNALNALGNLGTSDPDMAHTANITNYFGVVVAGIFAGSAVNLFGMKLVSLVGLTLTALLLLSFFGYAYFQLWPLWVVGLVAAVQACGDVGFLASLGSCLVLYPTEKERSRYLTIFFIISNLGGVVGAAMAMGLSWNSASSDGEGGLPWTSYLAVCCISAATILPAWWICDVKKTRRSDGSTVRADIETWRQEVAGLKSGLTDWNTYLLSVLFLCNLWHEVFLYSWVNGQVFNVRSRAINSGVYYLARIFASLLFEVVADYFHDLHRRVYACVGLTGSVVLLGCVCVCMLVFNVGGLDEGMGLDIGDPRAGVLIVAFIAYGALETLGSALAYWLIGVLPFGDPSVISRYAGWFRMFAALGAALAWSLDINQVIPYRWQFLITNILWIIGLSLILYLSHLILKREREVSKIIAVEEGSACGDSTAGKNSPNSSAV